MQENFEFALAQAEQHKEVPFPDDEFEARLTCVRQAMHERGIDLLFAMAPESLYYLSGFQGEWYQAQSGRNFPPSSGIAVHVDHDRHIHFETPSEAILTAMGTVSQDVRIFPLESRRDGLAFILAELKAQGWLHGTVGLELSNYRPNPAIARRYEDQFRAAGVAVVDGTEIVLGARHVKSEREMEAIDEAARIADIGMTAAREAIAPGVTELEVFGHMVSAMSSAGGEFSGILPPVMSGFRSNALHPLASRKVMQHGERVNVDLCGVYKRYHVNLCRGFWIGDPPDDAARQHEAAIGAFDIIEPMLEPGLNVRHLLESVRDYYTEQGILEQAYWSGGYELGIAFPPDWVGAYIYDLSMTADDESFKANTVVNHECNFFGPRGLGMSATIDTFLFRDDHARIASALPRAIQVV